MFATELHNDVCLIIDFTFLRRTTNSGKSTLAGKLVNKLPNSVKICQDTYFLSPDDPRLEPIYIPEVNHHNWEGKLLRGI
jgi:hypothetical protein